MRMFLPFLAITLAALGVVVWGGVTGPDCNDPAVWGTESGVRHCAVEGK